MSLEVALAVLVLIIVAGTGLATAVAMAIGMRSALNLRSVLIVVYVVVNPLSGVVHLLALRPDSRGYYDILSQRGTASLLVPVLFTALGLVALLAATRIRRPISERAAPRQLVSRDRKFLLVTGLVLLPFTVQATLQINNYAGTVDSERVVALTGGLARVGFLAQWNVFALSFLALWLCSSWWGRSEARRVVVLGTTLVLIALSLSWSGGRAIVLIMGLPLLLSQLEFVRRLKWPLAVVLSVAAFAYTAVLTNTRALANRGQSFNVLDAIDWQFGRFSMLGFANEYVSGAGEGLLAGSTFLAGALTVPNAILSLLGLPTVPTPPSSTELSGQFFLSTDDLVYIVPGFSAELFMNFGLFGAVLGYYLLGRIVALVDDRARCSRSTLQHYCLSYVGVVLIVCVIPSESRAVYNYLLFTGLPVIVAYAYSTLRSGRSSYSAVLPVGLRHREEAAVEGASTDPKVSAGGFPGRGSAPATRHNLSR